MVTYLCILQVVASLLKEFQLASELNNMKGIVPDDILDALKKKKLGLPGIDCEAPEKKNAMMAGEFEVILELLEKYKEGDVGKIAKAQVNILVYYILFRFCIKKNYTFISEQYCIKDKFCEIIIQNL